MAFTEIVGAIAILAGLYYIGIIISRCIILSARRMEVELQEKEINIKKEQLKLLEGEVHELELIGEGDEDFKEETKRITKEKLEVIIGGKVKPKNRW
jgi:flagellar motility protein MotE (MotC chaperone)